MALAVVVVWSSLLATSRPAAARVLPLPGGHRSTEAPSWTPPRTVAQPPGAGDATQPALAATPDGRLWLAFYRFDRHSTSVELWSSRNSAKTWRRRTVLMRRPVPRSGSYFLGDHQGLAATRSHIIAAFTMPVRSHAFRQEVEVARYATH